MDFPRYVKNWKTDEIIGVQFADDGMVFPLQSKAVADLEETPYPAIRWSTIEEAHTEIGKIIDKECSSRILAIADDNKQKNMLARNQELMDIRLNGETLNDQEQAEHNYMTSIWTKIKTLRRASNQMKGDLNSDLNVLQDWNKENLVWPEWE